MVAARGRTERILPITMADMSSQYINTMVFAVIAGILSLMLLLLIIYASDTVAQYSVFIMTVEGGLILVIAFAIYQIIAYERRNANQTKDGTQNMLSVSTCPDYWTMQGDGVTCQGQVMSGRDQRGQYWRYTVLGTNLPSQLPDHITPRSVSLSSLDNVSVARACDFLSTSKQPAPKQNDPLVSDVPWVDLRSVCDSYRLS